MASSMSSSTMAARNEPSTLFVRNLPLHITTQRLEEIFSAVGSVKRCFVVTEKGDKTISKGFAYVTFLSKSDAESAIEKIKTIDKTRVILKLANRRNVDANGKEEKIKSDKPTNKVKNARLIIRNLSFKATENDIKNEFSTYGKISEISIPKMNDGKMKGFCFVQFFEVKSANAALKEMNSKKIHGRPIAVDWAIPKDKYINITNKLSKKGEESNEDSKNNKSMDGDDEEDEDKDDDEEEEESEDAESADDDDDSNMENDLDEDSKSSDEEDDDDDADDEEDEDNMEMESDDESLSSLSKSKKRKISEDVNEGKTLFIRNVTFDTTKEDLKSAFEEFGKVKYAVICMDPETEHPKGTAFVKFEDKNDADKCLEKANDESEEGGIVLDGKKVTVCLAMSREEIIQKRDEAHKKVHKDNRHLYLAREGLIRPGTAAAESVSAADMNKRAKLEIWKGQMLKNLNTFISNTRLCVRNLPLSITDEALRKIYIKAAGNGANVTESRVIRNRANVGPSSVGESKGYGFVAFENHEQALKALRQTNNNPNIFSKNQRPIVEFSVEKRGAINAKLKRLEQSRKKLNLPKNVENSKNRKQSKNEKVNLPNENLVKDELYMGAKGRPGSKRVLPAFRGKAKKAKKTKK